MGASNAAVDGRYWASLAPWGVMTRITASSSKYSLSCPWSAGSAESTSGLAAAGDASFHRRQQAENVVGVAEKLGAKHRCFVGSRPSVRRYQCCRRSSGQCHVPVALRRHATRYAAWSPLRPSHGRSRVSEGGGPGERLPATGIFVHVARACRVPYWIARPEAEG